MDIIQRESIKLDGIAEAVELIKQMAEDGTSITGMIYALEARVKEGRDAIHEWYVSRSEFV